MPAKTCLVVIGNEILSGRNQDANTIFIARRLAELGIALESVHIIPDHAARIVETVNLCRAAYDYVFTMGGIEPTHDDITAGCIADTFGMHSVALVAKGYAPDRVEAASQEIRQLFIELGATPEEGEPSIN
ncbi:MAG: molybdopterin-binding protein [Acetobacteraceae bacterium]